LPLRQKHFPYNRWWNVNFGIEWHHHILLRVNPARDVEVMLDSREGFGAQLRGNFENLFRAIVVTKNFYNLIAVSVPQDNSIF
jgi:hypothetical protein